VAFTTDGHVVSPPFFPGGDMGTLAVCGTVNDLAVCGASPVALSLSLILEEGFPLASLRRILDSIRDAAAQVPVAVACGDTKVVERGKGDGIYLSTAGVGVVRPGFRPDPAAVIPGDVVVLTGPAGDHGAAILAARNGLALDVPVLSDVAPLPSLLLPAVDRLGRRIRIMRDPTRGGVGVALHELSGSCACRFLLRERSLPVREEVRGMCELLGFDPLYLACEGRALIVAERGAEEELVALLREHPLGRGAVVVGEVVEGKAGAVLATAAGGMRAVEYPAGEQLPRIC
jgi:hydrogenase expression/formation protein HypE